MQEALGGFAKVSLLNVHSQMLPYPHAFLMCMLCFRICRFNQGLRTCMIRP